MTRHSSLLPVRSLQAAAGLTAFLSLIGCGLEDEEGASREPAAEATHEPTSPVESPTLDEYGADPNIVSGTREEICRGGEAADRPGRAELSAYIDANWTAVIEVLGYECRELYDPTTPGCDREFDPEFSDCWSTHAAGRAIDIVVGGEPDLPTVDGVVLGDEIVTAFLAEKDGQPHYLARESGVQEIIWNDRCWHPADRDVLDAVSMKACSIPGHDNHVHLTLSDDGADGLTTWYRRNH